MAFFNRLCFPCFQKIEYPAEGDTISLKNTKEKTELEYEKKVTEKDIIGLIKNELPYNCVEIKKLNIRKYQC